MSALVVLNLLNKLGKDIKMQGLSSIIENDFSYFLTKTYVLGTQKNLLNETVLLSTQNTCLE